MNKIFLIFTAMDSLYTYLAIAGVLLVVFLFNNKKNKSVKKDRKSRSFKRAYYEKKKEDEKLKNK
ncbi:hypothetical protein SCB49_01899 [unidentified eubacterium SCB49]|nr:hypothetical protein SCB49_01899 [unidentified eubacterium SCB49]